MRGRLKEIKANASKEGCDQSLNAAIQNVVDGRRWADLLRLDNVVITNPYTTGTVTPTAGSAIIAGTATAWPVNDLIATTFGAVSYDIGRVEMAPASMASIVQGQYLLLDAGTGSEEIVVVDSTTSSTFFAQVRYAHAVGATIWASSFAGLQFWCMNHVRTVKVVHSATSLELDMRWGGPPFAGVPYSIYYGYVSVSPTARRLLDVWDPLAGRKIGIGRTMSWLNLWDPQRSSVSEPLELVEIPLSPGGVQRWEVWPRPQSARQLSVLYQDGWPELIADNDLSPPFLNSEIFINSAAADLLMIKTIARDGRQDPYFDPTAAAYWRGKHAETLETATQADEGRYLQGLTNYRQMMYGGSSNWDRSHAVSGDYGYGGGWGY